MKVLHVTNYLPGHHKTCGGAEQAAYRQITALQNHGVNNIVVTLKENFQRNENFKYYEIKTIETYLEKWIGNSACAVNRRFLYYDFVPKSKFRRIIKKEQPDLINFYNFNRLSFSLLAAAKKSSLPCALSIYDYWYFCPNEILIKNDKQLCYQFHGKHCINCYLFSRFNPVLRWTLLYRKSLFDRFLKKIDAFSVLSKSSGRLLQKYGISSEKIRVIPQFYSFDKSHLSNSNVPTGHQNYILFAGWLNYKKGLHVLVKAVKDVRSKIKNVKLLVLGIEDDKNYLSRIKKYIADNDLGQNIEFLKIPGTNELKKYLCNAAVLAVPEQWENMSPVIIVEAVFAGIPIVASRIGGIGEFVIDGKNGYLAQHNNPNDFAEKIVTLLSNRRLRTKFSKENKKLSQGKFSEKFILNKLLNRYEELVN